MGLMTLIFDWYAIRIKGWEPSLIPNLGALDLWVLEEFATYATDKQTYRQKQRLLPPSLVPKAFWFGVQGTVLNWFRSYLSSRCFRVKCNNNLSSLHKCDVDVEQELRSGVSGGVELTKTNESGWRK